VDLNLRARVRAGQPEAFSELFDECARLVYGHALRMTGNWSVAEEIVSLTFLEAWRLRGTVRPDDRPERKDRHMERCRRSRSLSRELDTQSYYRWLTPS
jgi:DNA-directed RNA polymerase specialized sigma24 family protein